MLKQNKDAVKDVKEPNAAAQNVYDEIRTCVRTYVGREIEREGERERGKEGDWQADKENSGRELPIEPTKQKSERAQS